MRDPFEFDSLHEDLVGLNEGVDNSWFPQNLTEVINGGGEPPPAILEFKTNRCLFYTGKVNGVYGQPECGKSWLVCYAIKQILMQGGSAWYIDFEDSRNTFVSRLRNLGVPDSLITSERCQYSHPDEPSLASLSQIELVLAYNNFDIIIVDSLNEAMWNDNLSPESNTDCGIFTQRLFKVLLASGACVICVDHEPKNNSDASYQFGGQQKKAMIRGTLLHIINMKPFGRGLTGISTLTVSKDTPGFVRAEAANGKDLGTFTVTSDLLTGNCEVELEVPLTEYDKKWALIKAYVGANPYCSTSAIRDNVGGKTQTVSNTLKDMVESGAVLFSKQGATIIHWLPGAVDNPL